MTENSYLITRLRKNLKPKSMKRISSLEVIVKPLEGHLKLIFCVDIILKKISKKNDPKVIKIFLLL